MTDIVAVTDWCDITQVGLKIKRQPTWDEYETAVKMWTTVHRLSAWVISDLYNFGEKKWGETYAQAMDDTGLSYGYLSVIRSVAKKIPRKRRNPNLSFSHHTAVAKLAPDQQTAFLSYAEKNGVNRDDFREMIKQKSLPDPAPVTIIHKPKLSLRELVAEYIKARADLDVVRERELLRKLEESVKDLL